MSVITDKRRVTGEWDAGTMPTLIEIGAFLNQLATAGVDPGTRVSEITPGRIVVEWDVTG